MPDVIKLLPDNVANQIAAGEVVQRPSSVVKELLENSIDAGATSIELMVKDGGRTLIQVVDNGFGMSETDARLAFERHATSKIRTTEDIFKISTKGFRGEALASIAAVSQVDLKTKKKEYSYGTHISINGGELIFQESTQCADGSNFSVKNLFYNVPARRKFLKSDNVENRHIIDEFHRVALAYPDLEFSLYNNDNQILKLRKSTEFQRIVDIFGKRLQNLLIPIEEETDWVKFHGFIGKSEAARKNRGEQYFFVNNRYFKSPYLSKAVQQAFDGLLQPSYIPSFFLFLDIDPSKIDVNIHPQKTEVKFEDENIIFAMIRSCVKKNLGIYNISPSLDFDRDPNKDAIFTSRKNHDRAVIPPISVDRNYNPFKNEIRTNNHDKIISLKEIYAENISSFPSKINLFDDLDDDFTDLIRLPNGLWVYNKDGKTFILDISRIYELIAYKKNHKEYSKNSQSQSLLFSHEIFLGEVEKNVYFTIKDELFKLGFNTDLNAETLYVHSIPEYLSEEEAIILLQNILIEYKENENDFFDFFENMRIKLYSKTASNFTRKQEVEELLIEFTKLGFPQYNHRKKKCYVELSLEELKNKLKS